MKAINWIVLAILAALSIIFMLLYFLLGFNLIDWPQGLVLGIVWWVAIIAVGAGLQIQKRYFIKKDNAIAVDTNSPQPENTNSSTKRTASTGTFLITAILVPTLVLCPFFSTNIGFADDTKTEAASQKAASGSSASDEKPPNDNKSDVDKKDAEAQSAGTATSTTTEQSNNASSHSNQFLSYYMLSIETVGVDVFYSINDSTLEEMKPGCELVTSFTDKIEFFVRPQVGYLTSSTFLHSANPNDFVTPDSSGIYSKLGENEQDGFENAVKSALEMGCTKEFHFQNKGTSAITKYKYRQFLITAEPFAITASFDLDGGTLDGASTYVDTDVYYGPDVAGHRLRNIINMPAADPVKENCTFSGWDAADTDSLYTAGASVDVTDYWRYLYDNSHDDGAVLPFAAQWEEDEIADAPTDDPNDKPSDEPNDEPVGSPSDAPSDNPTDSPSETPDSTPSDKPNEGPTGGVSSDTQGTTLPSQDSGTTTSNAGNDSSTSANKASNPFIGSEQHGKMLASNQRTAGSLREGIPFKDAITSTSNALRDGIYTVEDVIIDDPIAQGYGIAFSNRGCWVCDYLKAGIVLTLLYGAIVIVYRAARRNRKNMYTNNQDPIVGAVSG